MKSKATKTADLEQLRSEAPNQLSYRRNLALAWSAVLETLIGSTREQA